MEDISNIINVDVNENRPSLDSLKANENNVLNRSAENRHPGAESVALIQSCPFSAKPLLGNDNNNLENGKPNGSDGSVENGASLLSEARTTEADSIDCSSLANATASSIETDDSISAKSLLMDSGHENAFKSNSFIKSANVSLNETPVENVSHLSDTLPSEILNDKRNNLNDSIATLLSKMKINDSIVMDIEEEKNDSNMVVQDLVDFSFREPKSLEDIDSSSKLPEPSPNSTQEEISVNLIDSKPVNASAGMPEINCSIQVPENPTDSSKGSAKISAVAMGDSTNADSVPVTSASPTKEAAGKIVTADNTSRELEESSKIAEETDPSKLEVFDAEKSCTVFGDSISNEPTPRLSESPAKKVINEITAGNTTMELGNPSKSVEVAVVDSSKLDVLNAERNCILSEDSICTDSILQLESENPAKENLCKLSIANNASVEPENPSKAAEEVPVIDSSKLDVSGAEKNIALAGPISTDSSPRLSENPAKEAAINITIDAISMEMENDSKSLQEDSVVGSDKLDNSPVENEVAFQVPEIFSTNASFSERISFGMSSEELANPDFGFEIPASNPLQQLSEPDFGFKVPQVPADNPLEQLSNPEFGFKVPQAPASNTSGDLDFAFKIPENPPASEGDEHFVDAVQFFKDSNSMQFLESIRTSTVPPGSSTVPRSSLYVNFDPLHSKIQNNSPRPDNCALITAAIQENNVPIEKTSPEVVNKTLVDAATRESLGNILISFDSPKPSPNVDKIPAQTQPISKMFTEEEVQQKLKNFELECQEAYLKKQREMEMEVAWRDQLLKSMRLVIEEFSEISAKSLEEFRKDQEKMVALEAENEKLKEDLKTSGEDLQSVENTFTDFYKRYEQCKGMLKTYKDNEECLKQTISDLQAKAKEQEQMYHMLQERTEEMLEKANLEVDNVKRSGEAQATVLKAQLKKAEMKISSLESDIKQIKMENSQLGGICDDLMAKVSQT